MSKNNKRISTVWMWQAGETTWGVNLEAADGLLVWQEGMAAFGCVTTPAGQPITDFMANGPSRYASPPADVEAEIRESILALGLADAPAHKQDPRNVL